MRKQPKIIGFIGDCHPFEYGGGLVLDHGDGKPTLRYFEPHDDSDDSRFTVSDITLDRRIRIKGMDGTTYLVPEGYNDSWPYGPAKYREWYDDDLFHVAAFTGSTVSDLVDRVCSEDPMERASFYYDLASYHGWANVGHGDTESWRRMELKKVYAHRFAMARRRKYNRLDIWV